MNDDTRRKLEDEKQSLYFACYLLIAALLGFGAIAQISEEFKETGKLMVQLGVAILIAALLGKTLFHALKICKLDDGKP